MKIPAAKPFAYLTQLNGIGTMMEVPRRAVVARFPLPWSHYLILFTEDEAMRDPLGTLPNKIMDRECRLGITPAKKLEADVAAMRKRLERAGGTSVGPRK